MSTASASTRARVVWSAAVVVAASLPHWPLLPAWLPMTLCVAVAWRLAADRLGWRPPGRALRMLLAAAALCGVLAEFRTINGVIAGSALLVVMVALKLVETRTHRDEVVLMIISYFLVFASLLEHQSPVVGAYLVAFVLVTTAGLVQLGRGGPLLPSARTLGIAGGLLLKALPVMVVLFVLFPRLPGPLWALPTAPGTGTTGLSDSMTPGDISRLVLSDDVAFRVEFAGNAPPLGELYWRGPVLGEFDGRTWTRSLARRLDAPPRVEYLGEPVEYRVLLEPGTPGWTFALDMPRTWSEAGRLVMTSEYQLVARARRDFGRRLDYRATSHTRYRTLDAPGVHERRLLTHLPDGSSPRTVALVAGWQAQGLGGEALIRTALDYFRRQPFRYTLTPARLGARPVDEFLFETREGFCEHYASALAVMLRAAGMPARVVTGYHGGELNEFGHYYVVRQSDAHAWTEVWLEDRGWIRVDPTATIAPERIERGAASSLARFGGSAIGRVGWIRAIRHLWDTFDARWYELVIGYGETTQRMLLERLGFVSPSAARLLGATALGVALIFALFTLGHALASRSRPARDPAARAFDRFVRRLGRRGIRPPAPGETPSDYAERAALALPDDAPAVRAIAAAYLSARYEPDGDGDALRRLDALVRGFKRRRRDARASRETRSPASVPASGSGSRSTEPDRRALPHDPRRDSRQGVS